MRLTLYPAEAPLAALVLAHGAGAGQSSPFMMRTARGLAARGVSAATFDFPYITAGRRVPDRAEVLERAWVEALDEAGRQFGGTPLFIGGKSMGGRMASHLAAAGAGGIAGLVLLGYPLHPPGRPAQRRDAHLPAIGTPVLFVQGRRDTFGTADDIRELLPRLRAATLYEVAGGDLSFKVTGRGAPGADAVLSSVLDAVRDWIGRTLAADAR